MSWLTSTGLTDKTGIEKALENLQLQEWQASDCAVWDQFQAAKRAAVELVKTIPGPNINVTMSGHANGVGCVGKEGVSDDFITITVHQGVPQKGKESAWAWAKS